MSDLLWDEFEAWPSIMWNVLSGPGTVFSRPMAIEAEQVNCAKWALMY